jgi:hypothetical protein
MNDAFDAFDVATNVKYGVASSLSWPKPIHNMEMDITRLRASPPQKGRLSKCALKGSKHALNFFWVSLPHHYLAYWFFNLAYCQEYFQKCS